MACGTQIAKGIFGFVWQHDFGHVAVVLLAEYAYDAVFALRKAGDGVLGGIAEVFAIDFEDAVNSFASVAGADEFQFHKLIVFVDKGVILTDVLEACW